MTSLHRKILPGIVAILILACAGIAQAQVQLGIDVLQSENFAALQGKRVGLITNQTGVNSAGKKTRLILAHAPGVKLVALFSPEHGPDGTELAGKYVASRRDSATGLLVHSLYGPTRKPSPQMLAGIDVLVYDMQDIGSRSYTYISTMVKCMEAAGELGIEFVVLDRPNPLGGVRVEGPLIEPQWISFVGQIPVPYVHGMTAGEIARMANAFGWAQKRCKLSVIPMRGWQRQMTWVDTGLHWVPTSPNIPRANSPLYYVATGIVGELAGLEIGCGGPEPFEIIATKWLNAQSFTKYLQSLDMPGVTFSEYSRAGFQGSTIHIDSHAEANLCALGIYILAGINHGTNVFERSHGDKLQMFYKCYGSEAISAQIEKGVPVSRIVAGWAPGVARFEAERKPYLLY
ncbi:MAG: DUF1343 domain-containing protein [Chthoniobacteraceae bacterium]